jgi:hypothetical protein
MTGTVVPQGVVPTINKTALGVTAAAVIKALPALPSPANLSPLGYLGGIFVITAPTTSGALTLNDCINTTAYNSSTNPGGFQTSNDIVSFAYNNSQLVAGAYIQFATPIPFYNGLVVSAVGGGTPQYTLVYA